MTRSGELRGGPNSFDMLKQALDEVMDNKLHKLNEAILLTILALKSFREKTERDLKATCKKTISQDEDI